MAEKIRVKVMKPEGTGRRVGWNKLVTKVDDTKPGGYAFEGKVLDERQVDLEVGSVLVGQIPVGSARSGNHWRSGVVGASGVEWEERTWPLDDVLDFIDHVKALLRGPTSGDGSVVVLREEKERLLERVQEIDLLIEQAGNREA